MRKRLLRSILRLTGMLVLLYAVTCSGFFLAQESLIFRPASLPEDHAYRFDRPFTEHDIPVADGIALNALLFPAPGSRGVVLYLHGNAGNLQGWGNVADLFVAQGYDLFIVDYRGYGKSDGAIGSQAQWLADMQAVYDWLAQRYPENRITVLGHSIGSGPAAKLACDNAPRRLILQAPYYSLRALADELYPFLPGALLQYPLPTHEYLAGCGLPVTLIHGTADRIISAGNSRRLKDMLGERAQLVLVKGAGHNTLIGNPAYRVVMHNLLVADGTDGKGGP